MSAARADLIALWSDHLDAVTMASTHLRQRYHGEKPTKRSRSATTSSSSATAALASSSSSVLHTSLLRSSDQNHNNNQHQQHDTESPSLLQNKTQATTTTTTNAASSSSHTPQEVAPSRAESSPRRPVDIRSAAFELLIFQLTPNDHTNPMMFFRSQMRVLQRSLSSCVREGDITTTTSSAEEKEAARKEFKEIERIAYLLLQRLRRVPRELAFVDSTVDLAVLAIAKRVAEELHVSDANCIVARAAIVMAALVVRKANENCHTESSIPSGYLVMDAALQPVIRAIRLSLLRMESSPEEVPQEKREAMNELFDSAGIGPIFRQEKENSLSSLDLDQQAKLSSTHPLPEVQRSANADVDGSAQYAAAPLLREDSPQTQVL